MGGGSRLKCLVVPGQVRAQEEGKSLKLLSSNKEREYVAGF